MEHLSDLNLTILFSKNFNYIPEYLEDQIWNYAFLNSGLTLNYNGKKYHSENGLFDLLESKTDQESIRYPIMHFKGNDIECAVTHTNNYEKNTILL